VRFLPIALACAAHTFHVSRTEIDLYPTRTEVVVTLHAADLPFEAESEPIVCKYVLDNFAIRDVKLKCIGTKLSVHYVDVFLEGPAATAPVSVRNQILRKEFADQRNVVILKREAKPLGKAAEFTGNDEWRVLP
jgi:hypothetical protein